ncbi:hypothetical protein [Pseudomonas sp. NPDC087639]|uniref:hypothetical protein n=1 Tax=Pseudomonas sp. NPDC087639 TaxID=3364445 RepID=UPI00383053B8
MEECSYTYFTEMDQGERRVSLGGRDVQFSAVKGTIYTPATGLNTTVLDVATSRHVR